jgi:hypothetical protein
MLKAVYTVIFTGRMEEACSVNITDRLGILYVENIMPVLGVSA